MAARARHIERGICAREVDQPLLAIKQSSFSSDPCVRVSRSSFGRFIADTRYTALDPTSLVVGGLETTLPEGVAPLLDPSQVDFPGFTT